MGWVLSIFAFGIFLSNKEIGVLIASAIFAVSGAISFATVKICDVLSDNSEKDAN